MCSRLSPSSSGYKSQSQRSDATISPSPSPSPIPTVPCALHAQSSQNSGGSPEPRGAQTVMWAVTSISSVPPGSIIMNPRTNQPCTNSDGTIYRFDPDNPPKICNELHEEIVESIPEVEGESEIAPNSKAVNQSHRKREETNSHQESSPRNNPKCESKRQKCQTKTVAANSSQSRVTNSATSPTLPYAPSPPSIPAQQPMQPCQQPAQPLAQNTQQPIQETCQSLLKTVATNQPACPHGQTAQPTYMSYGQPEAAYGQPVVYGPANGIQQSGGLLVARHLSDVVVNQQPHQALQNNGPPPDMVFGQGAPLYGNYSMPIQQTAMQSNVSSHLFSIPLVH